VAVFSPSTSLRAS
ncbi:putative membrane protein, partial [Vibrio harveyi]